MHANTIYALIRKAISRAIGQQAPFRPRPDESLESNYGIGISARAALFQPLNEVFAEEGNPISPALTPNSTRNKDTVRALKTLIASRVAMMFIVVLICSMQFGSGNAVAAPHIEDYDLDNNSEVVTVEERNLYFSHTKTLKVAEFDTNRNGRIDPSELTAINLAITSHVVEESSAYFASQDDASPQVNQDPLPLNVVLGTLQQERRSLPAILTPEERERERRRQIEEEKRKYASEWKQYVRKSGTDISIRSGAQAIGRVPASLSFRHDEVSGTTSGRLTGAFGVLNELRIKDIHAPQDGSAYISAFTYGGSVSLDRSFDSRGSAFEVDSLTLRAGGDIELANLGFPVQYLSNYAVYETSTDFDTSRLGVESIYEPFSFTFLNAMPISNGALTSRFIPTATSRYENILNDPDNTLGVDEIWNLGFGAQFEIDYRADGKVVASLLSRYRHEWDVLNSSVDSYQWFNQLSLPLTSNGSASFLIEYTLSENDLTNKETNEIKAGLGFKLN